SPISPDTRPAPNRSTTTRITTIQCIRLKLPIKKSPACRLYLGVFRVSFQFDLILVSIRAVQTEPFERRIDRIEQPCRLKIVHSRQVTAALQPEMGQELLGGRISERAARHLATSGGADPARLHQHVERPFRDLH